MPNFSPRLEIYPQRIAENARVILGLCHNHGIQVAAVTKVTCAHPAVSQALLDAGVDMLADSRIENLQALRRLGATLPLMLLRIPAPSQAAEVVRWSDVSLNSSVATLRLLSQAAAFHGVLHRVILMVDLGDLREGIWPDRAVDALREAVTLPALDVIGLGCNLACYGGVIPTTEKMQQLIDLRHTCRAATGLELPVLCGGNSANLPLLAAGGMPPEINLLRIGETMLLGCSVIDRSALAGHPPGRSARGGRGDRAGTQALRSHRASAGRMPSAGRRNLWTAASVSALSATWGGRMWWWIISHQKIPVSSCWAAAATISFLMWKMRSKRLPSVRKSPSTLAMARCWRRALQPMYTKW